MLFEVVSIGPKLAIAPIIMAAISAAAALASGIAGAASTSAAAGQQADQMAKDRAMQERLTKLQLAQQKAQFDQNHMGQLQQALGSTYQNTADTMLQRGAERQKTRANLMSSLARLME